MLDEYRITTEERLASATTDLSVSDMWDKISDAFNTTSRDVLGFVKRRSENGWLSQQTLDLVEERKKLKGHKMKVLQLPSTIISSVER